MIKDAELKLNYVDGESFVNLPPVFSNNSQFVFLASLHRLYSYTTKTGKRFVEFKGIETDIVNFGVYQHDGSEFLAACSIDGTITCWKASNGLKIKQHNLRIGKVKFCEFFKTAGKHYIFLSWVSQENQLVSGLLSTENFKLRPLGLVYKNRKKRRLAIGAYDNNESLKNNQTFVAMIYEHMVLLDYLFLETQQQVKIRISQRKFTAIAAHPTEAAILTGDNTGRIVLWQNIFGDYTQAVYHWHTLPVNAVCFSSSATSFFSGADECVLVKWTVDNATNKSFLPRMTGCIQRLAIAPENLYLAIATKDDAVHIVDMQFNPVSIVQELVLGDEFPAGIHLDPKTRALVLNGTVGHLQFYSPHNRQLLYNLDVVGMNRITNERNNPIENTNIKCVAISKCGSWMATNEERSDNGAYFEGRLKFWSFNEAKQSYQLNTNVEYAHEGTVLDLQFQPSSKDNQRLVTIGEDGFFKIWQLVDVTTVYAKGFAWRCASSGFYRNLTPSAMAFSYDGSLLAVAFENILTTWLPDTMALKCSLLHSAHSQAIKRIAFGTSKQCHLIVAASKRRMCVWNLLTLSMIWTVPLRVAHLVTDPITTHMGIITQNNKLFIFEPNCETPLYVHDDLVDEGRTVMAAILVPTGRIHAQQRRQQWHDKTQLYIIDSNKELHCFDTSAANDDATLEPMHFLFDESETQSAFSHLTPAIKSGGAKSAQVVHDFTQKLSKSKLDDLLSGSIHTMVPMRMVAHAIINSMIHEKPMDIVDDNSEESSQPTQTNVERQRKLQLKSKVEQLTEDLAQISMAPVTWTSVFS